MKHLIGWICFVWICFAPVIAGAQDQNAESLNALMQHFDRWSSIYQKTGYRPPPNIVIQSPPWALYTAQSFNLTLPETQKGRLRRAAEQGKCAEVIHLETKGFLILYPHLKPALERADIRDYFQHQILPVASWPLVFCRSLLTLRSLPASSSALHYDWIFQNEHYGAQTAAYLALENMYKLAQCALYLPATLALLRLERQEHRLIMKPSRQDSLFRRLIGTEFETAFGPLPDHLRHRHHRHDQDQITIFPSCQKKHRNGYLFNLLLSAS